MIVDQHQLRANVLGQQRFAFGAVAGGPYLATPAGEQAVHADQNAVLVIDAKHLGAGQRGVLRLAALGCRARLAQCTGDRHGDAEHAALARPGAHFQRVFEYVAETVGDGQAQAQTFLRAGLVAVQAFELLEDHLQLVMRNARAAVPDFEPQ